MWIDQFINSTRREEKRTKRKKRSMELRKEDATLTVEEIAVAQQEDDQQKVDLSSEEEDDDEELDDEELAEALLALEEGGFSDGSADASAPADGVKKSRGFRGRFGTLRAKKKMASKIGQSKLGRRALTKLMGAEGNALVSALKSASARFYGRKVSKELKHDLFKWVLKASVLLQNKSLKKEDARPLKMPILLALERLVKEADTQVAGERDLSVVSNELKAVGAMLRPLLAPHCQNKNLGKVDRLVDHYADLAFLTKVMNDADYSLERDRIVSSLKFILIPFPNQLHDEETIRHASLRAKYLLAELASPSLLLCFDKQHPNLQLTFCKYLEQSGQKAAATALRFCIAEREFSHISASNLRAARAGILYRKFLIPPVHPSGDRLYTMNQQELQNVQAAIDSGSVPKNRFAAISADLKLGLSDPFQIFLQSSLCAEYMNGLQKELDELRSSFGNDLELPFERKGEGASAQQQQHHIFPTMNSL